MVGHMSKRKVPQFLSIPEFARRVRRSRQAIQHAVSKGQIPGCQRVAGPGRQPWCVPVQALSIYGV